MHSLLRSLARMTLLLTFASSAAYAGSGGACGGIYTIRQATCLECGDQVWIYVCSGGGSVCT